MTTSARRWHLCVAFLAVALFLVPACSGKDEKKGDDKRGADKKGDAGGDQQEDLGDATEFVLYERHQLIEGGVVSLAPALQQTCDPGSDPGSPLLSRTRGGSLLCHLYA